MDQQNQISYIKIKMETKEISDEKKITQVENELKFSSSPIRITETYPLDSTIIPSFYEKYLESVLIDSGLILSRIDKLALDIANHYKEEPFIILVILKGAFVTFSDLFRSLQDIYSKGSHSNWIHAEFIRLKSYVDEESTGNVTATGLEYLNITDKNILIVEDIVDTGVSMRFFLEHLKKKNPKSVKIFSLLLKEGKTNFEFPVDFVGFLIPNKFVVGYGLDFNEHFRDLKSLCILNKEGKEFFKNKD